MNINNENFPSSITDKENDINHSKKRRLDDVNGKAKETSCFIPSKEVNERFNYYQDVTNTNYASKLQSKIDLYQNIPTDFIKIKLLNGQDLDLNMFMENFSCFDVSLKV